MWQDDMHAVIRFIDIALRMRLSPVKQNCFFMNLTWLDRYKFSSYNLHSDIGVDSREEQVKPSSLHIHMNIQLLIPLLKEHVTQVTHICRSKLPSKRILMHST